MRKVTKRLLVAGFAAMVVSACQDSVNIIQPAPPPPPPPPPTVDATVTIQGLRSIPANLPVNPTVVFGDINVVLNIEEGTNTITDISLTLDGTPMACQGISSNLSPGEGVSLSSAAEEVECFFNTDDVLGACVGDQLTAAFANGTHTLGARVTLDDGTTRDASNAQEITLVNSSFIMVAMVDEGNTVLGSNGRLYHGGADLVFGACPVSYNGTVVGSLSLEADDNGGAVGSCDADQGGTAFGSCGDGDLGGGAGAPFAIAAPPFLATMSQSNNDARDEGSGDAGTGVEDSGFGIGHEVFVTGSVFDENGMNVTSEFGGGIISGFWVDLVPPRVNCSAGCAGFAASEITIDEPTGGSSTMLTWYSTGNYALSNVVEEASGWGFGSSASMDIGDCGDTDNSDAADATPFVPLYMDVSGIDEMNEEDWELGGDGFAGTDSGDDCLLGELRTLFDEVGNATFLDDPASIPIQIQTLGLGHGIDRTPADITNQEPDVAITVLNPDPDANQGINEMTGLGGDFCADTDDCTLFMDILDPDLASGDPGSGVDESSCPFCNPEVNAAITDGPGTTNDGEDLDVIDNGTANGVDEDYLVDLTAGPGGVTIPLADGDYVIDITADDSALPPNTAMHTFMFNLDDTAPTYGALNPAPVGSAGTDASAIVMTIGGTINDANIIDTGSLEVYVDGTDASGTGSDGTCDAATDYLLSVTSSEIDRNDISLENGTDVIPFNETFQIESPGAGTGSVDYCFILSAEDEAVLRDGTDQGNSSTLASIVEVVWN